MAPRKLWSQPQAGSMGYARTRKVLGSASLSVLTSDNITGTNLSMGMIPKGFVITGINMNIPILDSGAALVWNLGDAAVNNRLVTGSVIGRGSAGAVTSLAAGATYFKYLTDTEILLNIGTQSATPVAGAITNFYLEGFIADS